MNKVYANADDALAGVVKDGMTLMSGGFGLCGIPEALIEAVRKTGVEGPDRRLQQRRRRRHRPRHAAGDAARSGR